MVIGSYNGTKDFGAQVIEQKFPGQTYTDLKFEGRNIIASFNLLLNHA
ncbi:MAG: hypothetical protein IPI77_24110 [Saprospiraceae bacterium]|nr:hypothetical protein [Saprospiraceae bacterium]